MLGNFDPETSNLYVFLDEGELDTLRPETLEGELVNAKRPGEKPDTIELMYDDKLEHSKVKIGRIDDEDSGFSIVIGEDYYAELKDDTIYHGRVGAYQALPGSTKIWIFPPENRGDYEYMWENLQFYTGLTQEEREIYRDRVG